MPRIDDIFAALRRDGRKALMPFVCAGHPAPGRLGDLLEALERGGASIVEVGFPFSDPIADGPVIAAAMHAALARGTTPGAVMDEAAAARSRMQLGLIAMGSISIIHRCGGPEGFAARAARSGFDGILVPDLPLEESAPVAAAAAKHGLAFPLMIATTTPVERAEKIVQAATGFVYVLARAGITGAQSEGPQIGPRLTRLRTMTPLPLTVGFGVSTPDHVRAVARDADAAIVGSALIRRLDEAVGAGEDPAAAAEAFARWLCEGLRS